MERRDLSPVNGRHEEHVGAVDEKRHERDKAEHDRGDETSPR
jgi:hypothetical protein